MSDEVNRVNEGGADQTASRVSQSASEAMLSEVRSFQQHTNLSGDRCQQAPGSGEVPMLEIGVDTNGCTFGDGRRGPGRHSSQFPEFNTMALYEQALGENVRINIRGTTNGRPNETGGSGVIIGRDGERCVIATASHVTHPSDMRVNSRGVEMPNGRTYPATVPINDRSNDRAALVVNTGRDTDEICRPARAAAASGRPGQGWSTGFPEHSTSLYVSPTVINGIDRPHGPDSSGRTLDAPVHTTAHVRRGNSGGPIYNARGEVAGLVVARPDPAADGLYLRESIGTPFNQIVQRNWMARISDQRR